MNILDFLKKIIYFIDQCNIPYREYSPYFQEINIDPFLITNKREVHIQEHRIALYLFN